MRTWNITPEAARLHEAALVWDNHACMPFRADDSYLPQLQRCTDAGVNMVSLNVMFDALPVEKGLHTLARFRRWLLDRPEAYLLVDTVADVLRAQAEDKLAVSFDVEGMCALGGDLSMVRLYYDLGVRWMLIAYNLNNDAGGGCQDDDQGLTDFGRAVLDEMARVGMVLCCSHTGERTTMEVFAHTSNPVILSHSNPYALKAHHRNISDAVMKGCAETGGVVGLTGIGYFLIDGDVSTENFVRHIDYTVDLIGPEHVALALDYVFDQAELAEYLENNRDFYPESAGYVGLPGMMTPEQFPEITEALLRRGYPEAAVRGILGENLLRVCRTVWR